MKTTNSAIFRRKPTSDQKLRVKIRKSKSDRNLYIHIVGDDSPIEPKPRRLSFGNPRHLKTAFETPVNSKSTKKSSTFGSIGKKIRKKIDQMRSKPKQKVIPIICRNLSNNSVEFWEEDIE